MDTRRKYQIKAIFTPGCWLRNEPCDKEWDQKLWDAVEKCNILWFDQHHALVKMGDEIVEVWIANHPYGSGTLRTKNSRFALGCSRATALFLHSKLPQAKMMMTLRDYSDEEVQELQYRAYGID